MVPSCRAALSKRSLYGWKNNGKKVVERKPFNVKNLWKMVDTPLLDFNNLEMTGTRRFNQNQLRSDYQKRSWKLAEKVPMFIGFIYGKQKMSVSKTITLHLNDRFPDGTQLIIHDDTSTQNQLPMIIVILVVAVILLFLITILCYLRTRSKEKRELESVAHFSLPQESI